MPRNEMRNEFSPELLAMQWFGFMHDLHSELVQAYRMAAHEGLTQKEIARRIERDPGFVSRCLKGQQNMTVRTIHNLARAMGYRPKITLEALDSLSPANNQPGPSWVPFLDAGAPSGSNLDPNTGNDIARPKAA